MQALATSKITAAPIIQARLSVISIPREGGYAGAGHLAGYFVGL